MSRYAISHQCFVSLYSEIGNRDKTALVRKTIATVEMTENSDFR